MYNLGHAVVIKFNAGMLNISKSLKLEITV